MNERENALLIGNDINNATSNYSWVNLLKDLIDYAKLEEEPSMDGKPFPLFYEEILLSSAKRFGTKESRIKAYIAAKARRLKPNKIHDKILKLGIKTIFTTNYDLTLEESFNIDTKKTKNVGVIKESLYSLFRVNKVDDFKFWHIHGYDEVVQFSRTVILSDFLNRYYSKRRMVNPSPRSESVCNWG